MNTRLFALIVGIIYLVVGVAGFIPGLVAEPDGRFEDLAVHAGEGHLLGIFPINVLHNLVHLLVGVLGILAYRTFDAARLYSRGLAIFYGLLAVMGLIDAANLHTMFGLVPIFGNDVWLHALTAILAAYFGWGPVPARHEGARAI
jgi:hypothetical protein